MSRIAKNPIALPKGVEVTLATGSISVKGPLGTLKQALSPRVTVVLNDGKVSFVAADESHEASAMSGTLRALVTTSPKRLDALPGVPIMEETGITKYVAEIFYGVVAPAKTPPNALKNLSGMFLAAMKTPEMQAKFTQQGMFPVGSCGAPFGGFLRDIVADYERVITAAGIKAN